MLCDFASERGLPVELGFLAVVLRFRKNHLPRASTIHAGYEAPSMSRSLVRYPLLWSTTAMQPSPPKPPVEEPPTPEVPPPIPPTPPVPPGSPTPGDPPDPGRPPLEPPYPEPVPGPPPIMGFFP